MIKGGAVTLEIPENERKELIRRHLDSAEAWLRQLINHQLSEAFGKQFWTHVLADGSSLVKSEIRSAVARRRSAEPGRFAREVDALTLGQAIKIVCNPRLAPYFKEAFAGAYPDGLTEARTFLNRLDSFRNKVAHGGACSVRDVERAICYSNDLIDSLQSHFTKKNMARIYNVPTFMRFVDSKGNEFSFSASEDEQKILDWRARATGDLRPGEVLCVEVEVDSSFDPSEYEVSWRVFGGEAGTGPAATIQISNRHVGEQFELSFEVTSKKDWHRLLGGTDDRLSILYRVLPPVE